MNIVINYGRMNPPHLGHEAMIEYSKDIAKKESSDFKIYLTHTQNDKNPLSYEDKTEIINRIAGKDSVEIFPHSTIFKILEDLDGHYDSLTLVVGGDQYNEFSELFSKYQKDYEMKLKVVKFANRDKYNISATKMRQFVFDEDINNFITWSPKKLTLTQKLNLYQKTSLNMRKKFSYDKSKRTSKTSQATQSD